MLMFELSKGYLIHSCGMWICAWQKLVNLECIAMLSLRNEQSSQNWSGQGESDCLIKTKHCDGVGKVVTQCDVCSVL